MTTIAAPKCSPSTPRPSPPQGSPEVAIVIPVFNRCELTETCLDRIDANTTRKLRWEVIVVDNASSDGTDAMLRAAQHRYPWLRVRTNQSNVGFAKACNQGAAATRAPDILFLNNDTEPEPNWLEPLFRTLHCHPQVGIVGAKLLFPDRTVQHAGVYLADCRVTGDPFVAVHNHIKQDEHAPLVNQRQVYPIVTAACMLVRREAFDPIGGFDEEYWNGYEDVDLCLALAQNGWLCVYEPQSVLVHHESQSGPERFKRVSHNVQRLHQKWRPTRSVDYIFHTNGQIEPVNLDSIWPLHIPDDLSFDRVLDRLRSDLGRSAADSNLATPRHPAVPGSDPEQNFHVVLVQPDGYEHSMAFLEVAELLVASIRSLGRQAQMQINQINPAATNIILGYNLLPSTGNLRLVRHFIFQLEQLSQREGWFRPDLLEILRSADAVWDYSLENIQFLREHGLNEIHHLPIGYHDSMRRIARQNQDIDVLFYGSLNHRRREILEQIGQFATVKCLAGIYGKQRDQYIARSKIVLNLHYYDAQIMEQPRIAYLLNNRQFVISESSAINPFGENLVTCPYHEIVETVRYYLDNPRERFQRAKRSHTDFRNHPMTTSLQPLLELSEQTYHRA